MNFSWNCDWHIDWFHKHLPNSCKADHRALVASINNSPEELPVSSQLLSQSSPSWNFTGRCWRIASLKQQEVQQCKQTKLDPWNLRNPIDFFNQFQILLTPKTQTLCSHNENIWEQNIRIKCVEWSWENECPGLWCPPPSDT